MDMPAPIRLQIPAQDAIRTSVLQNSIWQLRRAEGEIEGTVEAWARRGIEGRVVHSGDGNRILLVPREIAPPIGMSEVLVVPEAVLSAVDVDGAVVDARAGRWLVPRREHLGDELGVWSAHRDAVRATWSGQFAFRAERREGSTLLEPGLRPPQIGALHALLAHWTVTTTEPATIVMPTGTGKTETMLAMLVAAQPHRLLVVVPTDALREQVAAKFVGFGLLQRFGVIGPGASRPVVGILKRRPKSVEEVNAVFHRCNVVVTTMAVAGGCTESVQQAMADAVSHLVIDEAHHIAASTWTRFRRFFAHRAVLQFTATPFRTDRKHVDGRVIYNYPLRKAQDEGFFKPVNFRAVVEYDIKDADVTIARIAHEQLDADMAAGLDHLVMARAGSIDRAQSVLEVYERADVARVAAGEAPWGAVLVHSNLSSPERRAALGRLRAREVRVVVCVDMFGEGFDMPELKVAALHDMHKSLAITLQFTGRFTRAREDLGDATMIANVAGAKVEEALQALYAEDADWNVVLRDLSAGATGRQAKRGELLRGFDPPPTAIPLQNVFPKMSTVVYRTKCKEWQPEAIARYIGEGRLHGDPSTNREAQAAIFVTRELEPVTWGDIREIVNMIWDVYLLHWDVEQQLLFIHSSNNRSLHEGLAAAVAGDDVALVSGEAMFRGFHELRRLVLMNLGLKHALSRNVQFTMYVGSDILEALSTAQQANKVKSNMFGRGYELGARASFGCSYKGRAWSYKRAADIGEWIEWCRAVGTKLVDESITTEAALRHVIVPKQVTARPEGVPVAVQWPDDLLDRNESIVEFRIGDQTATLLDVGIEVVYPAPDGPIRFRVFTETSSAEYELAFVNGGVEYRPTGSTTADVIISRRTRSLADFFREDPPAIHFSTGAFIINDALFELAAEHRPPYERDRIEVLDWAGVDLKKESQGLTKASDSVQRRVIEWLTGDSVQPPYDVVFDDDAAGEAADVVALRREGDRLTVLLVHCKFSKGDKPGARVNDLYEVCGQAQRSVTWRGDIERLLEHLERREASRKKAGQPSRFEQGDSTTLRRLRNRARELAPDVTVLIAQPGVSRQDASNSQLELMAVTDFYLRETAAVPLRVLASL
jgi:superfamily II DNA or RNA helicase